MNLSAKVKKIKFFDPICSFQRFLECFISEEAALFHLFLKKELLLYQTIRMGWFLAIKDRLFLRWTIRRILYSLVGGWIMIQSIIEHRWWLAVAGPYFFFMGLFAYGCGGGACNAPQYETGKADFTPDQE